jgi:hypothetical protein
VKRVVLTATFENNRMYQQPLSRTRKGKLGANSPDRVKQSGSIALNANALDNGAIWYTDGEVSKILYEFIPGMGWELASECTVELERQYFAEIKAEFDEQTKKQEAVA